MKRLINHFLIFACLVVALTSCDDDFISEYGTREDEYSVRYSVIYSTTYDFHNIAYISFTEFFYFNGEHSEYSGKPNQFERSIDGTKEYVTVSRVPKGSHVDFSTYVDVAEALPNTKVEISIEISDKGGGSPYTEVAKATADCPLKDNPLTISYDIPNE